MSTPTTFLQCPRGSDDINSKYCELKGKYKYEISNYIVSSQISLKIRIGYVLKSTDLGTLFSSRYSENPIHILTDTQALPHIRTYALLFKSF